VGGVGEQRLENLADLWELSPDGGRLDPEDDREASEEAAHQRNVLGFGVLAQGGQQHLAHLAEPAPNIKSLSTPA
jgi:hypothetical protein